MLLLLIAALAALLMGYAMQRGATCMVAAVDQAVTRRKFTRLGSIVEAALWVAGGLVLLRALDLAPPAPPLAPIGAATVAGGILLGIGAWVNRACVFGTLARIGNGEPVYLLSPLGFLAGAWLGHRAGMHAPVLTQGGDAPALPLWAGLAIAVLAAWRLVRMIRAPRGRDDHWDPHSATLMIGLAFLLLFVTAGAWAYTDVLADVARGHRAVDGERMLLLAALFGGAVMAGLRGGLLRWQAPTRAAALRCVAGGALMGAGSLLVPGSNDGLLLLGMPMLWPYAWVALIAMAVSIAAAIRLSHPVSAPMRAGP